MSSKENKSQDEHNSSEPNISEVSSHSSQKKPEKTDLKPELVEN